MSSTGHCCTRAVYDSSAGWWCPDHGDITGRLIAARGILDRFDWQHDDSQLALALEEIARLYA